MRVPGNDHAEPAGGRIDVELGEIVHHVEEDFPELHRFPLGNARAHGALSLFPRTTVSGAIARSASRTAGEPMSPA